MNTFKTLYLSEKINSKDLFSIENAIGRETSLVLSDMPAINIYTNDKNVIDDAIYWLGLAGVEVLEVA